MALTNGLYEPAKVVTQRNLKNGTTERSIGTGRKPNAPIGPRRGAPTTYLNQQPFETPVRDAVKINSGKVIDIASKKAGAVGEAAGEAATLLPEAGSGLKGVLGLAGKILGGIARIASPLNYVFIASELYKSKGNLLDGNGKIVSQKQEMAALAKAYGDKKPSEHNKSINRTY